MLKAEMVKGKLRDTTADKPIALSALLALRFIPSTFKLADRLPLRSVPLEPVLEQDLPDQPAEPLLEQDLPDQPAEIAKEDLPDQPVEPLTDGEEPTAIQDRAQDLLSSGKEVWAATVSGRTVLLEYVRKASWGGKQPDIVAKLINPQDADTVAGWSENRALPRILPQKQGDIWVSSQFLQAHCKKLSLEGSPRSDGQRERSRSPRRCKHAAEEEQAPAERRSFLGRAKDDKAEAAQPAEDVEMPDAKPAEEAEPAAVAEPAADAAPESALPDADAKPAEEAEDKPADAQPAEDAKPKLENQQRVQGLLGEIRDSWLELYLEDKAIYDDACFRVESGFLDGWVLDCEMMLDKEVTQLKELPKFGCLKTGARIRVQIRSLVDKVEAEFAARRQAKARAALAARQERARTHQLSDQDRAQVKRILSSGGEVWGAAKHSSDSTVLFQKLRNGLSIGQPAPDFFAKLINPRRDGKLVGVWCESVDRAKIMAYGKRGEFSC